MLIPCQHTYFQNDWNVQSMLLQVLRMHFLDLWEKATPVRPKDLKKQ